MPRLARQAWFNKQQTCIGTGDPIWIPAIVPGQIDYEGELAMVIGRRCKNVPNDKPAVLEVVAGFTIVNDVSLRDWQELEPGMVVSKSFDTHFPAGPWIVTTDEIGDPLEGPGPDRGAGLRRCVQRLRRPGAPEPGVEPEGETAPCRRW